jgi:hypothetical protein
MARTHLSVLDGEENESGVGLLQQRLILLLAVDVTHESLSVLLDGLLLLLGDDDVLDTGLLGSGSLELGQETGLGRLGSVEVDGGQGGSSHLGRSLDDGHGEVMVEEKLVKSLRGVMEWCRRLFN